MQRSCAERVRSDGTAAGTRQVKDIKHGSGDANPYRPTDVNGMLFFTARDGRHGRELWRSDGTARGTRLVTDIKSRGSSTPKLLKNLNGTLVFTADDGIHGRELWKTVPAMRPSEDERSRPSRSRGVPTTP